MSAPPPGLPINDPSKQASLPDYVVVTASGIQQRFGQTVDDWIKKEHKEVRFSFKRSTSLQEGDAGGMEVWYHMGPAALLKSTF